MTRQNRRLRHLMFASTALVAVNLASVASAQSTIDDAGIISIAAGLDGFIAATSQLGDGTTLAIGSNVTGEVTIDVTDPASITVDQTIFGTMIEATTRLNQATNTVDVSVADTGVAFTGSTDIDLATAAPADQITMNAAAGILNRQVIDGVDTDITAEIQGAAGGVVEILIDTLAIGGDLTASGNQIVADALGNDAANTMTVSGAGGAPLQDPVAIANLQSIEGTAVDITATVDAGLVQIDTSAAVASDITGDISLDTNVIAARAGANTATNQITAGNGTGYVVGTVAGTLDPSALDTVDIIGAFTADIGIASLQNIDAGLTVQAEVTNGQVLAVLDATDTVTGANVSLVGNQILAAAQGNTVTNRAFATVGGVDGVSVGVASLQDFAGAATGTATTIGSTVAAAEISLTGGEFEINGEIDISGNKVAATTTANEAQNVISLSSAGILGGSQAAAVGRQIATDVIATADVDGAILNASVNAAGVVGDAVRMNDNTVLASAALNSLSNVVFGSGSSALSSNTLIASGRQEISGGSVIATLASAELGIISGTGATASGTMTNNTLSAVATGNVASNTIVNRTASFSFTR
jgi:filamentous hemagglutinin